MDINGLDMLSEPFKALIGNQGLNHQFYDMLPIPIEIFAPDGTSIYMNKAALEMTGVKDASLIVGKYNLRTDPVCLKILGQDVIDKIFRGETVSFPNFPAPVQDLVDRNVIDEKPWEAATMDLFQLPIWDGDEFVCTITFFTVKNMYKGRADIAKAQEYIRQNWLDEFDLDKAARAANLSRRHFQRLFKENVNMSPVEFYRQVKINKLKEKLLDPDVDIAEAFAACGMDYHGSWLKIFKELAGQSPSEYRKENLSAK